jgi:Tetratricopeptide repeat
VDPHARERCNHSASHGPGRALVCHSSGSATILYRRRHTLSIYRFLDRSSTPPSSPLFFGIYIDAFCVYNSRYRKKVAIIYRLSALAVVGAVLCAQNTGRFAAMTAKGIDEVDKGRFNEAINLLEEVWEQDQSDPAVAENLAMAYLYADRNAAKAQTLMEAAIAKGGRASFLMQHAHEKGSVIAGEVSDYCAGRLSVSPDELVFTASRPEHSFSIRAGQFKEIRRNKWFGSSNGVWHLQTLDNRTYNLRPRTWSDAETKLVLYFIDKYIKR